MAQVNYTKDQMKEVTNAIRSELIGEVSRMLPTSIESMISYGVALDEFVLQIVRTTKQRLIMAQKQQYLTVDALWHVDVIKQTCLSIIGNIIKCVYDLGIVRPREDMERLELWDAQWAEEKWKCKRAKEIDTQLALSKKQQKALDEVSKGQASTLR